MTKALGASIVSSNASLDSVYLASPGTTSGTATLNGTSTNIGAGWESATIQFEVSATAASATVTFKVQGSFDNTNWFDAAYVTDTSDSVSTSTLTKTAIGAYLLFLTRPYPYLRLVTSANTNVTYNAVVFLEQ